MAQTSKVQKAVGRLVANADAVHHGRIEWGDFSRRNRRIWDEVHARGEEFTRLVSAALAMVTWK